jgi:mono/diheme cytochrome c family protein
MNNWKLAAPLMIAGTGFVMFPQEKAPAPYDVSGAYMFRTYCAACHGVDGKGGGPVAPAFRHAPPDLTLIAQRNHGEFPAFRMTHIIDGEEVIEAHGSREMPVWGDYFRDNAGRDEALIKLREHNLTEYIRSIQK